MIIVLGVVVGNLGKSHENVSVSVTPFPSGTSASAGHQEPPGRIGSSFELKDGSGNLYRVTLAKVIDPAKGENQFTVPDAGKRFVGLVFRVKALTGSPQDEDANNNAVVIGSNGQNYSADFDGIAGYTNFDHGAIQVSTGRDGDGFGHLPAAEGREGLDRPVDRAERIRRRRSSGSGPVSAAADLVSCQVGPLEPGQLGVCQPRQQAALRPAAADGLGAQSRPVEHRQADDAVARGAAIAECRYRRRDSDPLR